jgi:hypothetical protein
LNICGREGVGCKKTERKEVKRDGYGKDKTKIK